MTPQIASAYYGCKIQISDTVNPSRIQVVCASVLTGMELAKSKETKYQLLLTPIIDITDDHAKKVAQIIFPHQEEIDFTYEIGREEESVRIKINDSIELGIYSPISFAAAIIHSNQIASSGDYAPTLNTAAAVDYLRSLGYDCGYGTEITSLIEAGLAISQKDNQ